MARGWCSSLKSVQFDPLAVAGRTRWLPSHSRLPAHRRVLEREVALRRHQPDWREARCSSERPRPGVTAAAVAGRPTCAVAPYRSRLSKVAMVCSAANVPAVRSAHCCRIWRSLPTTTAGTALLWHRRHASPHLPVFPLQWRYVRAGRRPPCGRPRRQPRRLAGSRQLGSGALKCSAAPRTPRGSRGCGRGGRRAAMRHVVKSWTLFARTFCASAPRTPATSLR